MRIKKADTEHSRTISWDARVGLNSLGSARFELYYVVDSESLTRGLCFMLRLPVVAPDT